VRPPESRKPLNAVSENAKPKAKAGKKSGKEAAKSDEEIEREVSRVEKRISDISEEISTPAVARDRARLAELNAEYQELEKRLKALYAEWESSSESANA
jgi:ABC-type phosphate transport system auxiliary subunit